MKNNFKGLSQIELSLIEREAVIFELAMDYTWNFLGNEGRAPEEKYSELARIADEDLVLDVNSNGNQKFYIDMVGKGFATKEVMETLGNFLQLYIDISKYIVKK